jgi:hypothetical protein
MVRTRPSLPHWFQLATFRLKLLLLPTLLLLLQKASQLPRSNSRPAASKKTRLAGFFSPRSSDRAIAAPVINTRFIGQVAYSQ